MLRAEYDMIEQRLRAIGKEEAFIRKLIIAQTGKF